MFRSQRTTRRRRLALLPVTGVLFATAACSGLTPGGGSSDGDVSVSGKTLTAAEVSKLPKTTLTMLDYESDPGLGTAIATGIKMFEAKFPNITVKESRKSFADYGKTISLTMSSSTPPDIAESNATAVQTLAKAKLIRPLDTYYKGYSWDKQYPSSVLDSLRISSDGKTFGTGNYWGQTPGGNMVGIYYNRLKLKDLGLSVPTTFAELENALAKAKAAGEVPMELGNLEQWPANHNLSSLMNNYDDPKAVNNWINGVTGSTFNTPGTIEAIAKLKRWWDEGYLPTNANGTKDADAATAFADGKSGVFYLSGTWHMTQINSSLGKNAGFFSMPPMKAGGQSYATGSIAAAFTISAKSKNADLAAYFLDFLSTPDMAHTNLINGYLPFTGDAEGEGTVTNEVLASWRDKVKNDGLVGYLDSATPSLGNTLFPGIQAVFGGKETADDLARAVQADWTKTHG